MDPIAITTAAAKTVNTTLQVVQTCNDYYQKYKAVDLQLVCMQTQCSIIEVALLQIQDVIVHDSAHFERLRSVSVLASNYERTLGACQIVFAILKERLNKLNSHLRNNFGKPDWQLKLKVVWNDQESVMLLKNIEGQASAISLLLNAIQMKTQVEMLGLLTKKESKSILTTASDDADTLSLVHENNASDGLPDGESVITSKLDDTEFDFDFEIINTAAYRKAFNKARSRLPSEKQSQAVIPPHPPTSWGTGASETANLTSANNPAAIHSVVAGQENEFSSRPNALSQDIGSRSWLPKNSSEGACDGSGRMCEEQHDAGLDDQRPSTPRGSESSFGEYIVGQTIGIGRRGKVRLAWKKDGGYQVALKIIKCDSNAFDTNHKRIRSEFVLLRRLSHPNIIRLHEVFETRSYLAVFQDYIPGGSLAEYVAVHRHLSDMTPQRFFAQIISAVGYLHRKAVVHLGLSCSKVLLDSDQNVILTGFFNARTFDSKDRHLMSEYMNRRRFPMGDLISEHLKEPYYSAPEASLDGLYEGRKADVWSCGIMLYFMLAGYLPSAENRANPRGNNAQSRLEYICKMPLTFPMYILSQAQDLIKRMVVVQPAERADLREVAQHSWLSYSDYAHVVSDVVETPTNHKLSSDDILPFPSFLDMKSRYSLAKYSDGITATRIEIKSLVSGSRIDGKYVSCD